MAERDEQRIKERVDHIVWMFNTHTERSAATPRPHDENYHTGVMDGLSQALLLLKEFDPALFESIWERIEAESFQSELQGRRKRLATLERERNDFAESLARFQDRSGSKEGSIG